MVSKGPGMTRARACSVMLSLMIEAPSWPTLQPFEQNTSWHKTYQMWVFDFLHHCDIIQLDVQVLIHALQRAADRDIILELDGDFVVDQRFEEAEEQHSDGL